MIPFLTQKIAQAPMAGVTDYPFRQIERRFGDSLLFSEMLSAQSLAHAHKRTLKMAGIGRGETGIAMQLYGHEPEAVAAAAHILENEADIAFIDINMGCPVRKITSSGAGSALMKSPDTAAQIVEKTARAVKCPVTVKCRLGQDESHLNYIDFCRLMQKAGASAIFLHARTVGQGYAGRADWSAVAALKRALSIKVFGNGDITDEAQAAARLQETGCDGVMIGRGLWGKPWLSGYAESYLKTGILKNPPPPDELLSIILVHFELLEDYYGERNAVFVARKLLCRYAAGMAGAVEFRKRLFEMTNGRDVKNAVTDFFGHRA